MKYIAIKNDSSVMISQTTSEQYLLDNGYTLYTFEEYQSLILQNSTTSPHQTLSDLEDKSTEYIDYGTSLYKEVKKKVWAVNTYNISQGMVLSSEQMKTLLSTSDMLEKTLCSGSFKTAKDICYSLRNVLPQYSSIADYAILKLNTFMGL